MAMTGGTAKLVKSGTPSGFPSAVKVYVYYKEASQSIANNTTTISLGMYVTTPSGYDIGSWTDYNGSYIGTAKSGTNCKTFSGSIPNFSGTRWLVENQNITVEHDSDGKKSVTIYWKWGVSSPWANITNPSGSFTINLTDIPRAATITSAPNFNDEENPVIKYSNPAGSSVSALKACISLTGSKDDIAYRDISKTGTSYTFNLTDAERTVLRKATTGSNSRTVRFYIKTTIGGTDYTKYVSKTFSIINGKPTLSPVVKDTGTVSTQLTGNGSKYVIKGYNTIQLTSGAAAKKDATLKSYEITCGSQKLTTASGTLSNVESGAFTFSVTDNRGNTTTSSVSLTLINYVTLTCNLSVNAPSADGDMRFSIKGNYFNGSFGATSNTLTVQYRYKTNSGSYGSWTTVTPTISGSTYSVDVAITGLDYKNTYTVQARAMDKIYNGDTESAKTTSAKKVKTAPIFDWGEEDFNFNVPVTIQGNQIADFIIEYGTESMGSNGTWHWRKWASGRADCYGRRNFGAMAITTAWGSLFQSESFTQDLPSGLFSVVPMAISIDFNDANGGAWVARNGNTSPTATSTGSFTVLRPTSATLSRSWITFSVMGRWK